MTDSKRVFLVDDDPSARTGLARLLRTAGYDVRPFASGDEFLENLGPGTQGCLVLDARMPGLSGESLQAEFVARGVCLPVIIVSGDDDPKTRQMAQKMKAAGFFRKPVDATALLDAIKWVLETKGNTGE
jgi:FixJ family two-component response regulator